MVLATQNPVDMSGTYPLPEAQLDRFLMQISVGYPSFDNEVEILRTRRSVSEVVALEPVISSSEVVALQKAVEEVHCDDSIYDYIVRIVEATRNAEGVILGSSPRSSIALLKSSCAYALLNGRDYVIPDDVKKMAPFVLYNRIIMRGRVGVSDNTAQNVIKNILNSERVPKAVK